MTKLIFKSPDNPDWNGTYIKSEIQQEMAELGYHATSDWVNWIIDHMFDCDDLTEQAIDFITEEDSWLEIKLKLDNGTVIITKA